LENDKAAQQLEIVKLKARVKKLEKINEDKSSKLGRLKKVGTSQRVESSDDMENVVTAAATQVYKTATPTISTRVMVEHIIHEAKD
nr:hypothetical protein [Tanacetum cinerariifolium]